MFQKVCGTLSVLLLASVPVWAQGVPYDAIDLSKAKVYNSPADIASWPVTIAVTGLEIEPSFTPLEGVSMTFNPILPERWKKILGADGGNFQYTIWAVVKINGVWNTSGFIQMWQGRPDTGASILSGFAAYWAYDGRWGPMAHYQPHAGEQMGFFVSAGDARGVLGVSSVRERSNVVVVPLPADDSGVFTFSYPVRTHVKMDFDGDGRADLAVYRPSNGTGYILQSSTGAGVGYGGGLNTDIAIPSDYDGDGKTDPAVFRPTNGTWYIGLSSTGAGVSYAWGNASDVPVPGDYDGDGLSDIAVFRPGNGTWYVRYSGSGATAGFQWGNGLDVPVPGDYDGDGKTDFAVFRPSNGTWYVRYSSTGATVGFQWGNGLDKPVAADYDGDGKTDIAVFRPSNGTWYIRYSSTGATTGLQWGNGLDVPMPADYDGDGKADIAVFRPSNGTWYLQYSSTGTTAGAQWGNGADIPIALH